jgi:RimJ/RimL family protein N-acetyltransferase
VPQHESAVLRGAALAGRPGLLLRPWGRQDLPGLIEIYRDPVMRRSSQNPIVTALDARRWLATQQDGWETGRRLSFAILEDPAPATASQILGNVALKRNSTPVAEIGYWTAAAARGRGVASAAAELLTAWAFGRFGPDEVARIELIHQVTNAASCRVAQKAGYRFSAVIPASPPAFPADGHLHARDRPRPAPA